MDGFLFTVRHLLILREEIYQFEGSFVHTQRTLDFSSVFDAVHELWAGSTTNLSQGLTGSLMNMVQTGMPKLVEQRMDSRKQLNLDLKKVCEELIVFMANAVVEPLSTFLLKVSAFRVRRTDKNIALKEQSFAAPNEVWTMYESLLQCIDVRYGPYVERMKLYLENEKDRAVLLNQICTAILDTYKRFLDIIEYEYDAVTLAKFKTQKALQDLLRSKE